MTPHWKVTTALLPFLLAGCGDFMGMPSLEMHLPETFQQKAPDVKPHKLQKNWWRSTNDETLKAIIGTLETQNLSLEQARLRLLAAREGSRTLDYLPSLTVNARTDKLGTNAGGDFVQARDEGKTSYYYSTRIDASWELPIYGQFQDARMQTNAQVDFALADHEAVRASVISEAIRLYAEMREKQQEITLREAIGASAKKILDYQRIKHKAGLITDTELGRSQQSVLAAENDLTTTRSELVTCLQQLARLLGKVSPDAQWSDAADIPNFDLPVFDDTPADVLRNRPDIRKAENSVLLAAADFEFSKSEMYPKLSLEGFLSKSGSISGSSLIGKTSHLWGTPVISIPLFDWGKRLADAHAKDYKLSEAASAYRETVIHAINEVEDFWSSYRAAQTSETTSKEQATIAEQSRTHAALLFRQGITDGIEAENAAIEASRNTIVHLQSRMNTIARLTALTKALGGMSDTTTNESHHD